MAPTLFRMYTSNLFTLTLKCTLSCFGVRWLDRYHEKRRENAHVYLFHGFFLESVMILIRPETHCRSPYSSYD